MANKLSVRSVWWIDPSRLTLGFILPIYVFVAMIVPRFWPEVIVLRTHDYMAPRYAWLGAASLVCYALGAHLGARVRIGSQGTYNFQFPNRFLIGIGWFALAAYAVWFGPAIIRGQVFVERDELNRIPGVTSFTQLGVPFVIATAYMMLSAGSQVSRLLRATFVFIMFSTVFRVFVWSERLALIEIATPLSILFLTFYQPKRPALDLLFRVVASAGPFLAIPLLGFFFAATEVLRSWTSYSQTSDVSFVEFIVSRLTTYYFTALNNGAGLLAKTDWPTFQPRVVLDWLFSFPVVGTIFREAAGMRGDPHWEFLETYADVEFNNMSGIFIIFHDIGVELGLMYFTLVGVFAGIAYASMMRREPVGIMFFPPFFVGCLETLRISYVPSTRAFLVFVGAAMCVAFARRVHPLPKPASLAIEKVPARRA